MRKDFVSLYHGDSLDMYLKIKEKLRENSIEFQDKVVRKNDGWLRFFVMLFAVGRGSYGMNNEHAMSYKILVHNDDYERAAYLIKAIV